MILFITRKYPPSIGGMQRVCYQLAQRLANITSVKVIAWGGEQYFLPIFLPYAWLRASLMLLFSRRDIAVVHIGDGLLSPLGVILKYLFNVPVTVTIHGRDIVYPNRVYQSIVPKALARMDKVICVSHQIKDECVKRGVPASQCVVIPNGVNVDEFDIKISEAEKQKTLEQIIGRSIKNNPHILLTVGRLVPKKGIHFFIAEVLPEILKQNDNLIYLVVGDGSLRAQIELSIQKKGSQKQVYLLGKLAMDDKRLKILYSIADLFIMPNIPVDDDFEGFGVVALEASASGLYIVASKTDGVQDAVWEGINGSLVEPYNSDEFARVILNLLQDSKEVKCMRREKTRQLVETQFTWGVIAGSYLNLLNSL